MSRRIADELEGIGAGVRSRLGAKHEAREQALAESRRATRASANAVRATHRGDREQARALMDDAAAALEAARTACAEQPEIRYAGFVVDAEKEYAEARTTFDRCEELLAAMDDIYGLLVTVDFPEGVTGGLRRSIDAARATLERTRGDLATAQGQARLRRALESHRAHVLGDRDENPPTGD